MDLLGMENTYPFLEGHGIMHIFPPEGHIKHANLGLVRQAWTNDTGVQQLPRI